MFLMGKEKEFIFGKLVPINPMRGVLSSNDIPNIGFTVQNNDTSNVYSVFFNLVMNWIDPKEFNPTTAIELVVAEIQEQLGTYAFMSNIRLQIAKILGELPDRLANDASIQSFSRPASMRETPVKIVRLPTPQDNVWFELTNEARERHTLDGSVTFLGEEFFFKTKCLAATEAYRLTDMINREELQALFIEGLHLHFPWALQPPAHIERGHLIDNTIDFTNVLIFYPKDKGVPGRYTKEHYRTSPQQGTKAANELQAITPAYVERFKIIAART